MADIQRQFEKFHELIRIDYDTASELREKRDIVLERIGKHLTANSRPSCAELLQGSYIMKTGVKPIADLEYDIDIGLRFGVSEGDYDASTVRDWVFQAADGHTKRIENKGPCVRVVYEAGYHLDLVTYATWVDDLGEMQFRLAHKTEGWLPANPPALLKHVKDHREAYFKDSEDSATKTDQFRRCVRALRRWNDFQIPKEDPSKPCGLAFVLLCVQRGSSKVAFLDGRPDDRAYLATLARLIANTVGRVTVLKPTPGYEDLLAGLDAAAMDQFKARMGVLADALEFAGSTADPVRACEKLVEVFGPDFPVPSKDDTGQRTRAPAIITPIASA